MIYLTNNSRTTSRNDNFGFSYQVMSTNNGVTNLLREETRFNSMGEALHHIEAVKKALATNRYSIERDPGGMSYGAYILEEKGERVLMGVEGWQNPDDVRNFLQEMNMAMAEGMKVMT